MSGPTFTSPSAEVAEINRIQYELEYTEGISQRMRIPETLKVASEKQAGPLPLQQPLPIHTSLMQVPERIVVAGEDSQQHFRKRVNGRKCPACMQNCAWKAENEAGTQRSTHCLSRSLWPSTTSHFYLAVPLLTSSTGDDGDPLFSRPRDLDLIQSVPPVDLLNMKAPPRVLTLTEQPLDSLETDQTASSQSNPSQAVRVNQGFHFVSLLFLITMNWMSLINWTWHWSH